MSETPAQLQQRIARDPAAASDSDKLRAVANWIDATDARMGIPSDHTDAQDFLRGLALRLEVDLPCGECGEPRTRHNIACPAERL